jgi:hypothetical protein
MKAIDRLPRLRAPAARRDDPEAQLASIGMSALAPHSLHEPS